MELIPVNEENLPAAAEVHAVSWRDSHREICSPEFVAAHTTERQEAYLRGKLAEGSEVWLLTDGGRALGVASLTGSLIADLYVLPAERGKGYGSALLRFLLASLADGPAGEGVAAAHGILVDGVADVLTELLLVEIDHLGGIEVGV